MLLSTGRIELSQVLFFLVAGAFAVTAHPSPRRIEDQAAANTAYARALLVEGVIERRGGDLDLFVDPVQVRNPNGRIVLRQQSPEAMGEWEYQAPVLSAPEELPQPHDAPDRGQGVPAVNEPMLPLPDVPLILEDLLLQARQLADTDAPREAIDEILDRVDSLRYGRG